MPYFIVTWDAGYGSSTLIIEDECEDAALECAYDLWREEAQSQASYSAIPYSDEIAEEYGIEEEAKDLGIYKRED